MEVKQRVTMKLKKPNPLFEKWLTEWWVQERTKDSKMQYCLKKALHSIHKYPLPLKTGQDCKILNGFGPKLCQLLDETLSKHNQGIDFDTTLPYQPFKEVIEKPKKLGTNRKKPDVEDRPPKKVRTSSISPNNDKSMEYNPAWRSGGYAILITLYKDSLKLNSNGYMLKNSIIQLGQPLCDKSFTKTEPGTYYNSWSSMATLIKKNLIKKDSNPAKFSLTDQGLVIAHKLYKNNLKDIVQDNIVEDIIEENINGHIKDLVEDKTKEKKGKKLISKNKSDTCLINNENSNSVVDDFILAPNSFQIYLLVDTQETSGNSKQKTIEDETLSELNRLNVQYEVRHMKVGDYAWICRENTTKKELILPFIVERKRMDDFGCSIKDGRFHEQKFRLKQCGIQNLIYLVESYGNNSHTGLPLNTLYQAATNTLIQDEFSVKFTENLRGTMEYLSAFTNILTNIYKSKTLVCCPKKDLSTFSIQDDLIGLMTFKEFNQSAAKNKTFKVQELFVKQLLQLKGLSVDRALGIIEIYPTPKKLKEKYKECTEKQGEILLSNICYGKLRKKIGAVISKTIYQLYTLKKY